MSPGPTLPEVEATVNGAEKVKDVARRGKVDINDAKSSVDCQVAR